MDTSPGREKPLSDWSSALCCSSRRRCSRSARAACRSFAPAERASGDDDDEPPGARCRADGRNCSTSSRSSWFSAARSVSTAAWRLCVSSSGGVRAVEAFDLHHADEQEEHDRAEGSGGGRGVLELLVLVIWRDVSSSDGAARLSLASHRASGAGRSLENLRK